MKISHRNLDEFLRDPERWARAQGAGGFIPLGYDGYLRLGLFRYHKTADAVGARNHLQTALARATRLTNSNRKAETLGKFDQYIAWAGQSGVVVADFRVRLDLSLNTALNIGGEIHRIDISDTGYRGVIWGPSRNDLQQEIRFPILQLAISKHYGVPLLETAVAVQSVDGSDLVEHIFPKAQVDVAVQQFVNAAEAVRNQLR